MTEKPTYRFEPLTAKDKELHQRILLAELDYQAWYHIIWRGDVEEVEIIPIQ